MCIVIGPKPYNNVNVEGAIIIRRPLHELKNHITHLHIPSIYVIIHAVKTVFLAIVRWHFYDTDHLIIRNHLANFTYQLGPKMKSGHITAINDEHPYALESAVSFEPLRSDRFKDRIQFEDLKKLNTLSLTNVVTHFKTFDDSFCDPWNNPNLIMHYLTKSS